jgi:prepilin-type N-terminal cleavage/methylation domain-containing protein/prepilin-type processing-associated H-X9-DG protein
MLAVRARRAPGHLVIQFTVAGSGLLRYRTFMKRGLKFVRCPTDDLRRFRFAGARPPAGFSLIELLAVAAILLLLTALYWGPSTSGNRQRQARLDCQTHLQKIHMAMAIYANDHGGRFPELTGARSSEEALDTLVPRYTVDTAVFTCPGSKDALLPSGESFRNHTISYAYYMGRRATEAQQVLMSDRQVNPQAKAAGEFAFSSTGKPPGNNHGKLGGNFLFCDGHAEPTPPRVPFSLMLTGGVVLLNPNPK